MQPAISYKRLPGAASTWTGYHRLWLGPDHVLHVKTTTMNESYRRFFFADIQAITVRRTNLGKYFNAGFGGVFLLFALIGAQVPAPGWIVLLSFGAPFLMLLLANTALGPTCATYVRTAVQNERVPALSRVRAANRFLERVRPLVAQAQGPATRPAAETPLPEPSPPEEPPAP
jgi:hypothetical protein